MTQPVATPPDNEQHLKLLSIFHYVVAGLAVLFALFPVIHLIIGLGLVMSPVDMFETPEDAMGAAMVGWFFVIFSGVWILTGLTFSALIILTGRFISRRKRHTFCFVMACIECIFFPFGTALGIFAIMVLNRPSVKVLFEEASS